MNTMVLRILISITAFCAAAPCIADSGYKQLFRPVSSKLPLQDQQAIYSALGLKQSKDGKSFILDDCDPADFEVQAQDINGDGIAEVFVLGGNTCTSGHAVTSIWLFIKSKQGGYLMNFGFPAAAYSVLPERSKGFPDIRFGGPGFCEPVWRWNGQSYTHYKDIPTSKGECNHTR